MKLLTTYALNCGAKIDRPHIQKNYYPLPFGNYITLHDGSGMESKNYSYWLDVIDLISPFLHQMNIRVVQIGGKDVKPIEKAYSVVVKTNIYQTAYILSNSLLHIGNDSFACHMASAFGVPLVSVYGPTTIKNHSPYFCEDGNLFLHEADRSSRLPTFSTKEEPKTVDTIYPEDLANSAMEALTGRESMIKHKTVFIGDYYYGKVVEFVPDSIFNPSAFKDEILNVRMDKHFNEEVLARTLQTHKCRILTDKPININMLFSFRHNIDLVSYEIDESSDVQYVDDLIRAGVKVGLITDSVNDVSKIRFKFLDYEVDTKDVADKNKIDLLSDEAYNDLKFKSSRFIFSKGKVFTSFAHWKNNIAVKSMTESEASVIDDDDFWEDMHFFNFYRT